MTHSESRPLIEERPHALLLIATAGSIAIGLMVGALHSPSSGVLAAFGSFCGFVLFLGGLEEGLDRLDCSLALLSADLSSPTAAEATLSYDNLCTPASHTLTRVQIGTVGLLVALLGVTLDWWFLAPVYLWLSITLGFVHVSERALSKRACSTLIVFSNIIEMRWPNGTVQLPCRTTVVTSCPNQQQFTMLDHLGDYYLCLLPPGGHSRLRKLVDSLRYEDAAQPSAELDHTRA
ncbi:MAG: hypothetical protein K8J08_15815 [Thermoanaerobaculia bacterium]|nr:hypothetical protein [Thermoanaerobaculia bacterium]